MTPATLNVKKYGNRRLYDTEASSYITLEDLGRLIRSGRDVRVVDAKSGQDLTKSVLLQIISEQEKDKDLLPVSFLKKMIQVGDSSLRDALQRYLTVSLETFLHAQKDFEERYRHLAGNFFNPMTWMMPPSDPSIRPTTAPDSPAAPAPAPPPAPPAGPATEEKNGAIAPETQEQIQSLREQVAQIQTMLSRLARGQK